MRYLQHPTKPIRRWFEDEVLWGVPRREGYSDTDDPKVHQRLVQHAFELGQDERAICGFKPPRRPSKAYAIARPQLATAARENPRCSKCLARIAPGTPDMAAPASVEAPVGAGLTQSVAASLIDEQSVPRGLGWQPRQRVSVVVPDTDPASGEQAPAFQPPVEERAGLARARARRRSVRRGGRLTIQAGRRSVALTVRAAIAGAGVVASVVDAPAGVRVVSISLNDVGRARITLNKVVDAPVTVEWFLVSALDHDLGGENTE